MAWNKAYSAHRVLEGFDFALEAGTVTALLGPNGAGKSTVAGLLMGRLLPDEGRVRLFGHDPSHQLARARMVAIAASPKTSSEHSKAPPLGSISPRSSSSHAESQVHEINENDYESDS